MNCAGACGFGFVGMEMYESTPCGLKPALVGEKGEVTFDMVPGIFGKCPWLVSTLGVIVSPLGIFLWNDDDFRFLLGPMLPPLVGEAGLDRLVGVIVVDVACEL